MSENIGARRIPLNFKLKNPTTYRKDDWSPEKINN